MITCYSSFVRLSVCYIVTKQLIPVNFVNPQATLGQYYFRDSGLPVKPMTPLFP